MRRTPVICLLAVTLLSLADASGQFSGPPRIFILLPGQTFVEGVGAVGTPDVMLQRKGFHVEIYAVDSFGNIDSSYEGDILDIRVAGDTPPPGEPPHPPARRFGMSVSGIGAAMAIPPGSLRVSLGGSAFQEVTHGGASTPQGVCDAIVTAIRGVEPHRYGAGELDVKCATSGTRHRFFAIIDRTDMKLLLGADIPRSIAFDPAFGSAPALKLGSVYDPNDPADPNDAAEFAPRNVVPPAAADLKFSRGMAFFEVSALHVSGPGQMIAIDQVGAGLPVETDTFTVLPLTLTVESVRLRDINDDGSIDLAVIRMTEPLDPLSLPLNPSDFTLTPAGSSAIPGSAVTIVPTDDPGYQTDEIEVTFGTGIGRTDITDVELTYSSPSGMLGARSGTVVVNFTIADSTSDPASVRLIDAAPPVLVSAFAQDVDGNGGLDRMTFLFSEPVKFSAGRGMSVGVPFNPAIDPDTLSFPVPSPLRLSLSGLTAVEDEVSVVGGDPNQSLVTGAAQMDGALTGAIRRGPPVPAWGGATVTFDRARRRLVFVSGTVGDGSKVTVDAATEPGDLAPLLRLGTANGGVERPGHGDGVADLDSLVILGADGANLLLGKTESDIVIAGNAVTMELTNVPGSGTVTPTYFWRDDGDGGFLTDKALVPNHAAPMNNAGLDPYFNPKELLVEASATSGPDLVLRVTRNPGPTQLDASQSILPLTSVDDGQLVDFIWTQVSGPVIPGGVPPNNGVVTFTPTVAGVYVFELTLTVPDATGASYNDYLDPDRTLRRRLEMTVTPGPAEDVVILLPGQTLTPGVTSAQDAVTGIPRVATEGVPYEIELVATDAFYNEAVPPPGSMARVTTTDPFDDEPPYQAFAGSRVRIRITPSDAATAMIPEVDDEVLVAFEHGDIHHPYVVGSLWDVSATAETDALGRVKVKFAWLPDTRALRWNVYRGSALAIRDFNRDGLPDVAYGTCVTSLDPDPTDALFEDVEEPAPHDIFIYLGTMEMIAFGIVQETSLGVTGGLQERPNLQPCP